MNIPQKVIYCSYIFNWIGYIYSALESRLFMSRDFICLTNLIVLLWCNCPFILQGFFCFLKWIWVFVLLKLKLMFDLWEEPTPHNNVNRHYFFWFISLIVSFASSDMKTLYPLYLLSINNSDYHDYDITKLCILILNKTFFSGANREQFWTFCCIFPEN